ncbi:hypothetical protein ABT373_15260 [Streptomyces sp. NPDC000070]|uniref:hypothetical protein n=1 Tax=Streptomyces sp. NPDC000070 TaxID=3154240 RepID=UPI00331FD2EE
MSATPYQSFIDAPWTAAYVRLANHCITCAMCTAVDKEGVNLGLACATADQLNEKYRQARRACNALASPARDSSDSKGVEIETGALDRPR